MLFDFTTASRDELRRVWKAISDEMGDDQFFTTKELDHLPKMLDEYEQVLAFSSGLHKGNTWLIVLTGERILFLDKGMFFGIQTSSIELERVNNFDYKKGIMFGSISIGSNAETYEITNVWKKTVEPFTLKLREALKARKNGITLLSPGTAPAGNDIDSENSPRDDDYTDTVSGDYEVYTPPSASESGPLAMEALQPSATTETAPAQDDSGSAALTPIEASRQRLKQAGLL